MKLWHLQYDCGDYYCDGMHTVGIFDHEPNLDEVWTKFADRHKKEIGYKPTYSKLEYRVTSVNEIEGYGE